MRYVRTENDVYELYYNSEFEYYEVITKGLDRTRGQFIITENNIGKYETADTIKELCDEFVGINKSGDVIVQRVLASSLKELKDSLKTELNGKTYISKYDVIYGAIWTSKGLIYVAKMNVDGELELL